MRGDCLRFRRGQYSVTQGHELAAGVRPGIGLEDASRLLHQLCKSPVATALAVGQGPPPENPAAVGLHGQPQLLTEPAFTDPSGPEHRDQVGPRVAYHTPPRANEDVELGVSSHYWHRRDGPFNWRRGDVDRT